MGAEPREHREAGTWLTRAEDAKNTNDAGAIAWIRAAIVEKNAVSTPCSHWVESAVPQQGSSGAAEDFTAQQTRVRHGAVPMALPGLPAQRLAVTVGRTQASSPVEGEGLREGLRSDRRATWITTPEAAGRAGGEQHEDDPARGHGHPQYLARIERSN